MEQGLTAIIISVFIIFLFVPTVFLKTNNTDTENLKQNLYFATTALADSIEIESKNYDELSKGYARYMENFDASKANIRIDESKLLLEFNNLLFKNYQDPEIYSKIQANIMVKILIYNDRFVVIGQQYAGNYDYREEFEKYKSGTVDKFGPSYYFTYTKDGNVYYLNAKNDNLYDMDMKVLAKYEDFVNGVKVTEPKYTYFIKYQIDTDDNGIDEEYFLNISNNKVYKKYKNIIDSDEVGYYNANLDQIVIPKKIYDVDLPKKEKNEIIIEKINSVISDYTDGLKINFPNPENLFQDIRKKELDFFEGVTFLVIYKQDSYLNIRKESMDFKKHVVAGYTLK